MFAEYSTHREPSENGISLPKTHPSGSEPVHVTKSKADSGNVCISGYKKTAPNFRTVVLSYHFLTVFTISCFRKINLTSTKLFRIIVKLYRGVAQLVARVVRVHEAGRSSRLTPTKSPLIPMDSEDFFFVFALIFYGYPACALSCASSAFISRISATSFSSHSSRVWA